MTQYASSGCNVTNIVEKLWCHEVANQLLVGFETGIRSFHCEVKARCHKADALLGSGPSIKLFGSTSENVDDFAIVGHDDGRSAERKYEDLR